MFDSVHDSIKIMQHMLQQDVNFNIEHKTVRKGRLILYNVNDYYFKFTILTKKDVIKTYEVPYPYKILTTDTSVRFSYKIQDLVRKNHAKELLARQFEPVSNKLYDKYMLITCTDV
jgi:hypothetical protein